MLGALGLDNSRVQLICHKLVSSRMKEGATRLLSSIDVHMILLVYTIQFIFLNLAALNDVKDPSSRFVKQSILRIRLTDLLGDSFLPVYQ